MEFGKFCLRSRVWITVLPTENDSTRLYKNGDISAVLGVANSDLVGRNSKCYFIIKFGLLPSIRFCWREVRLDAGKTTEKCEENEFVSSFL